MFRTMKGSSLLPAILALVALAAATTPTGTHAQDPSVVKSVQLFAQATSRAVWSPRGDQIAFSRREANGYMQIYVARADLSDPRCLSCRNFDLRKLHVGNPTWHPSGDYLVAQANKPVKSGGEPLRFMEVPGANLGSDLFMIPTDGRGAWNLTLLGERGGRVLSPHFSHEGDKLLWSERVSSGGGAFGKWVLRVSQLEVKRGIPRLKGVETYRPGEQKLFYDSHGFTTDDHGVVLSGNLEPDQPESGMDVYTFNTESSRLKRLTDTYDELDRFALAAPNGNWIAWTSSRGLGSGTVDIQRRQVSAVRAGDLWLMNAEGLSVQRLTRFNDVHSPQFAGRVMVIPTSWNRDGNRLLVEVLAVGSNEPGDTYVIEFNEPIGR